MSDDMRERGCEQYDDELAELALGVLTGRDRARVLSHVESCPRCAEELENLSRAADCGGAGGPGDGAAVGLRGAPLRTDGPDRRAPRRRRLRPSRWVPAVVGVAAAALALGLGLSLTSSSPTPTVTAQPHGTSHRVMTAALVENGETVGHVMTVGGAKPWMSMMLADSSARGTVNCVVVTDDGVTHTGRDVRGRQGLRGVDRPAARQPGRRAHRRGGVAQRDGDRHRHAGLTTASSSGRCRACRAPRPGRRCSRPAPGSAS